MSVKNINVNDLAESIYRSGYPMMTERLDCDTFNREVANIRYQMAEKMYDAPHLKRAISLANAKGGGHNQFLSGILVSFDLTASNKMWVELERYRYLTFISSESTMHRASQFSLTQCVNEYVDTTIIAKCKQLQNEYNVIDAEEFPEEKRDAYLRLLYNLPSGFDLAAGLTTNYRCLRNVYEQRHNHPLPEWRNFSIQPVSTTPAECTHGWGSPWPRTSTPRYC